MKPIQLTNLAECERVIERGLTTFIDVGLALKAIRDDRMYRETHATFEDYCRERWGWNRDRAYKLIAASDVADCIQLDTKPTNEAQARPLTKLPASDRASAWSEAVATAPGGKVTAKHVEAVVSERVNGDTQGGAARIAERSALACEDDSGAGGGKNVRSTKNHPVSDANQFASMAIRQLERIRDDDPKVIIELDRVSKWIAERKRKL